MNSTSTSSQLFEHPPHQKGIITGDWTITTTKTPISNSSESELASSSLHLPLPEICFGNNRLEIKNESKGISWKWDTIEALRAVEKESGLKVAHAEEWAAGQKKSGSTQEMQVQKPFDWTYTTLYKGDFDNATTDFIPAPPSHPGIPLHLLARHDIPIEFFDEIPLFEDELGDNGIAELTLRVRVNSFSIFILSRFFLRIDHVLFRIYDNRIYIPLDSTSTSSSSTSTSNEIIREIKGRQSSYSLLKSRLPPDSPNDLTPLTSIPWVSSQLDQIASLPSSPPPPSPIKRPTPTRTPSRSSLNSNSGVGGVGGGGGGGGAKKVQWPRSPDLVTNLGRMGLSTGVGFGGREGEGERERGEGEVVERWVGEGRKLEVMRF